MENSLVKKGEDICRTIDHLLDEDNKFIIDKTILYCKYCLRLNKDEVNSLAKNFYEECEDYLEKFNIKNKLEIESIEKQFITSYQSNLASEGKEICKEVESQFDDYDLFKMEKAYNYSNFLSYLTGVDPKLYERCQKYKSDFRNLNNYKKNFYNDIEFERKEKQELIDMGNMRLKGI